MIDPSLSPENHSRPPLLFESRAALELTRMLVPLVGSHVRPTPTRSASPIIIAPGFGADDRYTRPLRSYLRLQGYRADGWGLGKNLAGIDIEHVIDDISAAWQVPAKEDYRGEGSVPLLCDRLVDRIRERHREIGQRISLIGWSLGGFIVREAARELPDVVDRVITMGAPVIGGPKYTAAARFFRRRGADLDFIEAAIEKREARPITQPITAIYSKSDAIVSWPAAIDHFSKNVQHIEVNATHLGMGFNPAIWDHIVEALESDSTHRS